MKKYIIILIIFILTACQGNDVVSKEEYENVVRERDYYKELYEKLVNDQDASIDKDEDTILDIELSMDNFDDYFELITISAGSSDGKEYYQIIPRSKLYDDGWIYRECNPSFSIVFDISGYEQFYTSIRDVTNMAWPVDGFQLTLVDVKGKIRYERKESIIEYNWDTFHRYRTVKFSDGYTSKEPISENEEYKY